VQAGCSVVTNKKNIGLVKVPADPTPGETVSFLGHQKDSLLRCRTYEPEDRRNQKRHPSQMVARGTNGARNRTRPEDLGDPRRKISQKNTKIGVKSLRESLKKHVRGFASGQGSPEKGEKKEDLGKCGWPLGGEECSEAATATGSRGKGHGTDTGAQGGG